MASVQRCAAQHPGRRAAETVCRQFQCPRLHFSRRHLRQIWLSWRHGLPLGTEIWGGEDAEFEPRCLRRTWRLSRFWPTTWKRNPSVSPAVAAFGSLNRRLRQQTATCVLRRLNTEICPAKGPVAVDAGALSLIAFRRPRQPSCGGGPGAGAVRHVPPAAQFRRALSPPAAGSPACSCAAGRSGEVSAPGLAVLLGRAPVGCPPLRGCGGPRGRRFPRCPSILQHTETGAAARQHRQQAPAASPKRKAPWKP